MSRRLSTRILLALTCVLCVANATRAEQATASISGSVVAAGSATPIAGAEITVYRWGINSVLPIAGTTTDANGSYQVDGIVPDGFPLFVKADGGDYLSVQEWQNADCPPVPLFCGAHGTALYPSAGETLANIDFALNPAGVIQGHVTRTDTAMPVKGAFIAPFYFTSTDAAGLFRLRSVAPGQYRIRAVADDLITTFNDGQQCDDFLDCDGIDAAPFDVAANATTTVDIALASGVSISGQAFVEGDPTAPRPAVYLYNESDPQRPRINPTANFYPPPPNDYSFRNLIARTYSVRFGDPADSSVISEYFDNVACPQDPCALGAVTYFTTSPGQAIDGIDAVVAARQKISGRVLDAQDLTPIPGASVQVLVVFKDIFGGSRWNAIAETHSSAQGTFSAVRIPANTAYVLRVNADGYLGMQQPDLPCDQSNAYCLTSPTYAPPGFIGQDQTVDVGDIALAKGGKIAGRVTIAGTTQGLPNVTVALYQDDVPVTFFSTDADGYYSSGALSSHAFTLFATTPVQSQMYDHVVCAGPNDCDLALATPVVVNGSTAYSAIDFSLRDPDVVFVSSFE